MDAPWAGADPRREHFTRGAQNRALRPSRPELQVGSALQVEGQGEEGGLAGWCPQRALSGPQAAGAHWPRDAWQVAVRVRLS